MVRATAAPTDNHFISQDLGSVPELYVFLHQRLTIRMVNARYDCVVHWAKLEKPRSEEEAIDTTARLRRRCVYKYTTIRENKCQNVPKFRR